LLIAREAGQRKEIKVVRVRVLEELTVLMAKVLVMADMVVQDLKATLVC